MLKAIFRAAALVIVVTFSLLTSPTIIKSSKESEAYNNQASNFVAENTQPTLIVAEIRSEKDNRAEILAKFLESQGSPMTQDAEALVEIADKYGLDWKFLPAIAGVESTYGQAVPGYSHNPYGWNNGNMRFSNWEAASDYVAREIVTRWGAGSEITPWRVGPGYAATPTWAARVSTNMRLIADYQ